jgi:hypothetical protein
MSPDRERLEGRLKACGLRGFRRVEVHENRSVMVSVTLGQVLRLHRGYAGAPDEVLRAIVDFVRPRAPLARRAEARQRLLAFPIVHRGAPRPARVDRPQPGDVARLERLTQLHERLNREHFSGRLRTIPIRLSSRMRTRLGELLLEEGTNRASCIVISASHLRRDGWAEVAETLLHEMVHQWQSEIGLPVDHGEAFRRRAAALGIEPRAWRAPARRHAARH